MKTASHRYSPLLAMGSAMAKGWRWLHSLAGVARVLILMHQVTLDLQMELEALVETKQEVLVETCVATVLVEASVETVMALVETGLKLSLEMVLEASVEIEATASVEMEPMDLMEIEEMDLVELEATALVEIEATALVEIQPMASVEMVPSVETQVGTLVASLLEALVETELKDQDREVLGAIKQGLAEEGSSLVMAWGQALALATAIKALRQWPSIRPQ